MVKYKAKGVIILILLQYAKGDSNIGFFDNFKNVFGYHVK